MCMLLDKFFYCCNKDKCMDLVVSVYCGIIVILLLDILYLIFVRFYFNWIFYVVVWFLDCYSC